MPTVVDATAGLGRDAFVLASLGCKAEALIERSPRGGGGPAPGRSDPGGAGSRR